MDYSYDRRKTAASFDLYEEWREITDKHEKAQQQEYTALLKKAGMYLKSVGYDMDEHRSYISKQYAGSDGTRLAGQLMITEREENNTVARNGQAVARWVADALGVHGSAQLIKTLPETNRSGEPLKIWLVDITAS
jgi:hypothetical protein